MHEKTKRFFRGTIVGLPEWIVVGKGYPAHAVIERIHFEKDNSILVDLKDVDGNSDVQNVWLGKSIVTIEKENPNSVEYVSLRITHESETEIWLSLEPPNQESLSLMRYMKPYGAFFNDNVWKIPVETIIKFRDKFPIHITSVADRIRNSRVITARIGTDITIEGLNKSERKIIKNRFRIRLPEKKLQDIVTFGKERFEWADSFTPEGDRCIRVDYRWIWDGKIDTISENIGKIFIPSNLWKEVKETLMDMFPDVEVDTSPIDILRESTFGDPVEMSRLPFELRGYQKDIIRSVTEVLDRAISEKEPVSVQYALATAGGKTAINAELIRHFRMSGVTGKVIYVVPTRTLLIQTHNNLEDLLGIPIGMAGNGKRHDMDKDVIVATRDSLYAFLKKNDLVHKIDTQGHERRGRIRGESGILTRDDIDVSVLIFDETHTAASSTACEIVDAMGFYKVACTATPFRHDGLIDIVNMRFGNPVIHIKAKTLLDDPEGPYVTPVHVEYVPVPGKAEPKNVLSAKIAAKTLIRLGKDSLLITTSTALKETIRKSLEGMDTECINDLLKKKNWKNLITEISRFTYADLQGNRTQTSSGTPSIRIRERAFEALKSGVIDAIISTDICGTGFDIPKLRNLVVAQPTSSPNNIYQWLGRLMRPFDGKDFAKACILLYRSSGSTSTAIIDIIQANPVWITRKSL